MEQNSRLLEKEVWSRKDYYDVAAEGSLNFSHPAMKELQKLAKNAKIILDMGCGEGTRLSKIAGKNQVGYGIDVSAKAISLAKKKYPKLKFIVGNLEKLPYKDLSFDLIYSAFVFEHLNNPEKVIIEGDRVLAKGGNYLIVAPNFGAPNRISPPSTQNRFIKLTTGFFKDFVPGTGLHWRKVKPIATANKYEIDWDTTIEPYLGTLIRYLKSIDMKVNYYSSCWDEESGNAGFFQKLFRFLGESGIYPFKLWGPHLLIVAQK